MFNSKEHYKDYYYYYYYYYYYNYYYYYYYPANISTLIRGLIDFGHGGRYDVYLRG